MRDLRRLAFTLITLALFFIACAGNSPIVQSESVKKIKLASIEIPSYDWDSYSIIELDSHNFPDSVSFILPIGEKALDIKTASLSDEVEGWEEECDFAFREFGIPYGSNIVIIEDVSASMGGYIPFTDKLIWGLVSTLTGHGGEVAFIRFGESTETVTDWILPDSFLNLTPEELPYPQERGSDFIGALDEALKLISKRRSSRCAIVLFSDGDFADHELPITIIDRAKRNNVSVNVLIHSRNLPGVLADIADETGGIYMVQPELGFSAQLVSAIISKSYRITYYPKHVELDGALHRIALRFPNSVRYKGEFRAPGTISSDRIDMIVHNDDFVMPDELTKTIIVPFDSIGNAELMPSIEEFLDHYIMLLSELPDSMKFILKIGGFACNLGPAGINIRLSRKRAETVRDYIRPRLNKNFEIQLAWHGELYPLNTNSTDLERRANRRAELRVERLEF